ncbi:MAG: hypothetical protein RQ750_17310 [Roseovarius sp.]|nr:hypothetical protein [Roseovarius sp.]
MMHHWPETLPQGPLIGLNLSPVDVRATFEPEVGEPISRPRTTGAPFMADAEWVMVGAQISAFEAFYASSLGQGAARFAMREVTTNQLRLWRFMGTYQRQFRKKDVATISAKLMMLPNVPWFAPYGREGLSTIPAWVADYENGVFGIDAVKATAAELPSISGTFLVRRVTTSQVTEGQEVIAAGDITEAQPVGTNLIIGYAI